MTTLCFKTLPLSFFFLLYTHWEAHGIIHTHTILETWLLSTHTHTLSSDFDRYHSLKLHQSAWESEQKVTRNRWLLWGTCAFVRSPRSVILSGLDLASKFRFDRGPLPHPTTAHSITTRNRPIFVVWAPLCYRLVWDIRDEKGSATLAMTTISQVLANLYVTISCS